jgi:fructose-bisphosphate aldolase/6-deoxy-5-ketofructose 1-phosphate synthase
MPKKINVEVPADVPSAKRAQYARNFTKMTGGTGRLMLFAGDQKIEHLNADFFGPGIAEDDGDPVHLFRIASKARIGCFASQLGLIARYGAQFPKVPYLVKLNSKSNIVKTSAKDPMSSALWSVEDVVRFAKDSKLDVLGVGYTIYLGSEFEDAMLAEAAQVILSAHRNGMLAVIWCYPRGKGVADEKEPHLIAGAAGVAATLGADFVKVNPPKQEGSSSAELLKEAVAAAGNTRVVCAGGGADEPEVFLKKLYDQMHIGGTMGSATGRNVHQRPLKEAVAMCNAISALTMDGASLEKGMAIYRKGI